VDSVRFSPSYTSPIINGLSDHDVQVNNTTAAGNLVMLKHKVRKVNNEKIMQFQHLVKSETWIYVHKDNDTNNKFNSFLYTFLSIFESSLPIKYKSIRKIKSDWITQIIKISSKCESLYLQ
jgi:hypothetical protein